MTVNPAASITIAARKQTVVTVRWLTDQERQKSVEEE